MVKQKLVIIDTGCANLSSVKMAFERLGQSPLVSADPTRIRQADKLIFPGVGAAHAAMNNLLERKLVEVIRTANQPLFGFCLGMQMLAEGSYENLNTRDPQRLVDGLAIIPGIVRKMQVGNLRLPHMGWDQIEHDERHPLLKGIPSGSYFYFVHSYALELNNATLARCDYGQPFSAMVAQDNFFGAQFHPERSGPMGGKLLQNFLEL